MPYIAGKERRAELRGGAIAQNAGELNYQISKRVISQSNERGHTILEDMAHYLEQYLGKTPNYQKWNDIIGVLVCSSEELLRRELIEPRTYYDYNKLICQIYDNYIAPYEDSKIISNGDIIDDE